MRELKRYMNRIIFTPMICEKSLPMGLDLIPIYDATGNKNQNIGQIIIKGIPIILK
jgi:hypothetical protein